MGERRRKSGRRMEKSLWVRLLRRKSGRRMEKTLWVRDVERVGEEWRNRYG